MLRFKKPDLYDMNNITLFFLAFVLPSFFFFNETFFVSE